MKTRSVNAQENEKKKTKQTFFVVVDVKISQKLRLLLNWLLLHDRMHMN